MPLVISFNTRALTLSGFKELLKSFTIIPDFENVRSAGVEVAELLNKPLAILAR